MTSDHEFRSTSLLGQSALIRFAATLVVLVLLWLAIRWAIFLP
jgi:hypothetical protein